MAVIGGRKRAKRGPGRAALIGVGAAALLLAALWLGRAPLLTALGSLLIVDEPVQPADLIFLLNGELETRPFHASALYRAGMVPEVALARVEALPAVEMGLMPNESDVAVEVLIREGVPPAQILMLATPGGVTSTFDEARALRGYVEQRPIRRVILVTSAFHTRRARWIMRRELAGSGVTLTVSAAPHYAFAPADWWQHEEGLLMFVGEAIKWPYYLLSYR